MAGPLRRLCQSHGTTMFVLMLTAVKVLFSKFAPEEEVMLFTSTGQNKVGHSNLIGLFANLILLRTSLKGNPSFPTLLKRVKETTLSAIAHQNLPFEDMLDHLQWQSITGNNNLFQLIFIYQQPYQVSLQLEGVSSELMSAGEHLGAFDIRFFLEDNGKSLLGEIEYNTAQYGSALVQSLVEKLTSILEIIVTDENVSLDTLVVQQKTAVLPIPPPLTNHLPPRDEIEAQLLVLWQEILKTDAIGIRDNFFDLGGHSLLAARLFAKIHKTLGKNLPLASLIHSPTIEALAKLIKDDTGEREWQSLIPIQSGGQKPPLFLVHGAGGNILLYRDLAEALGPDQPVFGLQARGLDGRGDYFTDFKAMAAHYLQEIKIIQPEGPYLLGGYCLGGALAYEMAQQLHQAGQETALVAMFETFNIHANPATYDGTYKTIHKLQNLWFHTDNILKLPLKGKFAFFREKFAVQKQRTKQKISLMVQKRNNSVNDEELIHLLIDKINDDAHEAYRPQTYQGQVAVFRPIKDFKGMEDPAYGWGELIPKEKLIVKYLKVNPKGMMVTPFSKDLARQLSQLIDASLREAKQEGNGQPV